MSRLKRVLSNEHGTPHNFHVHDVQFRALEVDGKQPPPELRGAKDTVFVPPHKTVKLVMRFDGHGACTALTHGALTCRL